MQIKRLIKNFFTIKYKKTNVNFFIFSISLTLFVSFFIGLPFTILFYCTYYNLVGSWGAFYMFVLFLPFTTFVGFMNLVTCSLSLFGFYVFFKICIEHCKNVYNNTNGEDLEEVKKFNNEEPSNGNAPLI